MRARTLSFRRHMMLVILLLLSACAPVSSNDPRLTTPIESKQSTSAAATPTPFRFVPTSTVTSRTVDETPIPHKQLQLTYVVRQASGNSAVYAIDIGCLDKQQPCLGEPELLFEVPVVVHAMAWSPDGTQVALDGPSELGVDDIFVMAWNGADFTNLTNSPEVEELQSWSPDGTQIIYLHFPFMEGAEAWLLSLLSGSTSRILSDVRDPSVIQWVSATNEIYYVSRISPTDVRTQIYIANYDSTQHVPVLYDPAKFTSVNGVAIAPDGKRLAFVAEVVPQTGPSTIDIYVVNSDGSYEVNLTKGDHFAFGVTWSPVGDWIAFQDQQNGKYDIYIMRPDGSQRLKVTQYESDAVLPAWRFAGSP